MPAFDGFRSHSSRMHSMKRHSRARSLLLGLAVLGIASVARPSVSAAASAQEVATASQLKTEAYQALRIGQFDRTNELLERAASLSHDPIDQRIAEWTHHFDANQREFDNDRHKQYEKAVGDVKLLTQKGHLDYAIDADRGAYLLAKDKEAFRKDSANDTLIRQAIARADQYDHNEQWVKSLRIYSDLAAIEPSTPEWKDKLKLATRHVRLLALYAPENLRKLQDSDQKERDEVDQLLHPTTQPTTKPSEQPDADSAFKVDWQEQLRGVRIDMLEDALRQANDHYFRNVDYRTLALGGLNGLKTLVNTKGLEKAFPALADEQRKAAFPTRSKWILRTIRRPSPVPSSARSITRCSTCEGKTAVRFVFLMKCWSANLPTARLASSIHSAA